MDSLAGSPLFFLLPDFHALLHGALPAREKRVSGYLCEGMCVCTGMSDDSFLKIFPFLSFLSYPSMSFLFSLSSPAALQRNIFV